MDPIIVIESSPVSISGNCYVSYGQPVYFTVVSGISSGIAVSFQWYLNGGLVSIQSGYTLLNPTTDDVVHVNIINCCCSCSGGTGGGGTWIEDINFDFYGQVYAGDSQLFYVDTYASFNYKILSAVLMCGPDEATMSSVEVCIDGTPVVWIGSATSIDVNDFIISTDAISANNVSVTNVVTLITSGFDTGSPDTIRGKLKIQRN